MTIEDIKSVNKTFKVDVEIGGKIRKFKVVFIGEYNENEKRKLFHSYYGKKYNHLIDNSVRNSELVLYIEKLWSIHSLTICNKNGLVVGSTYPSRAREDARDWTNKLSHSEEWLIQKASIKALHKYYS